MFSTTILIFFDYENITRFCRNIHFGLVTLMGMGGEGERGRIFTGRREMKIFSTVFRGFGEKHGRETVFSTLDGAGNY